MEDAVPRPDEAEVALGTAIAGIVEKQRAFAAAGTARDVAFRRDRLRQLKSVLKQNESRLFEAIAADMRKSPFESYLTELGLVYHEIDEAIARVAAWSRPQRRSTGIMNWPASGRIVPEPFGVTLVIGAWNYPYQLTLAPLVAARATPASSSRANCPPGPRRRWHRC